MAKERTLERKPLARQTLREAPAQRRGGATAPTTLVEEVQAKLGNNQVSELVSGRSADAAGLYLADLLHLSSVTGEDFSAYLPWRATGEWQRFATAWYRVIAAERERAGVGGPIEAAPGVDVGGMDLGASEAAGVDETVSIGEIAGADLGREGAAEAVARAARGPDFNDPEAMNAWFDKLMNQTGSGRALDREERAFLQEVHGRPIPSTRIHEDGVARRSSEEINARAFTIGNEIWMGEDVDLTTPQGAELLAHEITHVLQNALGRGAKGDAVTMPGDPVEVEAEAKGREGARLVADGWQMEPPEAIDGRGRALVGWIRDQLPATPTEPPPELVREGLRHLLEARAEQRIDALRAELERARVSGADPRELAGAVAALDRAHSAVASTTSPDLGMLLRIAGPPTSGELSAVQAGFAPYPGFVASAEATLRELAGPDPITGLLASLAPVDVDAAPTRIGGVRDVDAGRAVRTAQLVADLARQLSLPSGVQVRADEGAAARTQALGVRGVMEGGAVLLDPAAYDPTTLDGQALLAHEMVHLAQDVLPAAEGVDAGRFAEAEAHLAADRFAAGQAIQPLEVGLPDGHMAAEGDITGKDLQDLLGQYKQLNEQRTGGLGAPAGGGTGSASTNATESHAKKIADYKKGVDGVAGALSEVDGFDDLCEYNGVTLIGEKPDAGKAMAQVKKSEPYQQLCDMWQGAKEGKDDSGELMAAFNEEMSGRGFWASTTTTFAAIAAEAKKDARVAAEAAAAKAELAKAESEKGKIEPSAGVKDAGKAGKGKVQGVDGGGAGGGGLAALMDAKVEDMPKTPNLDRMKGSDDAFARIVFERKHQKGLGNETAAGGLGTRRGGEVWDQFSENFVGSFGQSFTDQFKDTLILDTLGAVADKGLTALVKVTLKGPFKAPFIGPAIGLIQSKPWSDDFWSNKEGQGALDKLGLGEMGKGKGISALGSAGSNFAKAFEQKDFSDGVGVFCAGLADLFGGLRDILDACATLIGTLSALCYVIGGFFILAGLALLCFGGVGGPLLTAGGWLVRAGGILARINTVLGLIVLALSALAAVFRVAAALLVPAEMYATQLGAVGEDAKGFGEKTGAKLGDATASKIKDGVSKVVTPDTKKADGQEGDGEKKGVDDAKKVKEQVEDGNQKLEGATEKIKDKVQKAKDEAEAKKKTQDGDDAKKGSGDTPARVKRALVMGLKIVGVIVASPVRAIGQTASDMKTEFGRIGKTFTEAGKLFSDPRGAAADGLAPMREELDKRMEKAREKHKAAVDKVSDTHARIVDLKAELKTAKENGASTTEVDAIRQKLSGAKRDLEASKNAIKGSYAGMRVEIKKAQFLKDQASGGSERAAAKSDKRTQQADDLEATEKKLAEKENAKKAAENEAKKLKKQAGDEAKKLEDAKKKSKKAKAVKDADQQALDEAKKHVDGKQEADNQKKQADELRAKQKAHTDTAAELDKRAVDVDKARQIRKDAEALEARVEATATNAEKSKRTLDGHAGKSVTVELDGKNVVGRVVSVGPDGVVVTHADGSTKTHPFDSVTRPKSFADAGERYAEQASKAEVAKNELTKKNAEADKLDPNKEDPEKLRDRAEKKRASAAKLDGKIRTADEKATYGGTDKTLEGLKKDQSELATKRNASSKAAGETDAEVLALQKKLDETQKSMEGKKDDATRLTGEIEQTKTERDAAESSEQNLAYIRDVSSGNATGGVGSSYKDFFEKGESFLSWFDYNGTPEQGVLDVLAMVTEGIGLVDAFPARTGADGEPATLGGMVNDQIEGLTGAPEDAADVTAIGKAHELRELKVRDLLVKTPPADILEMVEHQEKAKEAFARVQAEHDQARRAYSAELAVDGLAAQTKGLAEQQGKPLHAASKKTRAPILKGKPEEQKRKQVLSTAKDDTKGSDSSLAGVVMDIIQKVSKHSDRYEGNADAGKSDGGTQVANKQDEVKKETTQRKKDSTAASDEQIAVIDQALALQANQEATIGKNIESLQEKYDAEMTLKGEIQRIKAEALARRNTALGECESEAGTFNAQQTAMSQWAGEYNARREEITKLGGGE